jgi:hypothetical protein
MSWVSRIVFDFAVESGLHVEVEIGQFELRIHYGALDSKIGE